MMPLGLPVVPEVYSRNSGCSASNASGGVFGRRRVDDVVPPQVASVVPGHVDSGAPHHQNVFDGAVGVRRPLRRPRPSAAPACRAGTARQLVISSLASASAIRAPQRGGGEAGEHHAVHDAQPRAGQHRDHGLGDHRHVDRDAVTGNQTQAGQRVGGLAHLGLQIGCRSGRGLRRPARPPSGWRPGRRCRLRRDGPRSCRRR